MALGCATTQRKKETVIFFEQTGCSYTYRHIFVELFCASLGKKGITFVEEEIGAVEASPFQHSPNLVGLNKLIIHIGKTMLSIN